MSLEFQRVPEGLRWLSASGFNWGINKSKGF